MDPEQKEKENAEKRRALYDIMSCMRDIRKRTDRTDTMFEPLKDTVALLHAFGIQLNDNVLQQLENAEFKWKGLKKKMLNRREQLASLQQAEVRVCWVGWVCMLVIWYAGRCAVGMEIHGAVRVCMR